MPESEKNDPQVEPINQLEPHPDSGLLIDHTLSPEPADLVTLPVVKPTILIVEDDDSIRTQLKWALTDEYEVFLADDRQNALRLVCEKRPEVVTLDLGLPPHPIEVQEGFAALEEILTEDPLVKVIVVTGRSEKEHALKAIGQGAYDMFCKPVEINELKIVLRRAVHVARLERDYRELQQRLNDNVFEGMLGTCSKMQEIFLKIHKVARSDVPVLITGESGTGKELVARAIHRQSVRKEFPFVAINCSAIPETLLESELFGHEKGSFTGAHVQRKGRFELAQKGTLFLDEIGELSPALQVKLLRFLQEQKLERVGGRESITVDARVLAATNKDLKQAMKEEQFREDLFYRLGVVTIALPPLREREGDVSVIASALLQKYADENKKGITRFSAQALRVMEKYHWPGNIRELENRIRRAVIMAQDSTITPMDLELPAQGSTYEGMSLKEAREALEREMVQKAFSRHKGNLTQVAAELGISRPTLYELIEKFGIEKKRT